MAVATVHRWYVLVTVLVCAVALMGYLLRDGGCFTTKTVVTFTLPATSSLQWDNGTTDESVIAFASAVANEINAGQTAPRYAAADAPFYGAGVRQGVLVGLPNNGGQWSTSFAYAIIEIQIVGRTYAWVEQQQQRLLSRIEETTRAQQRGAAPRQRITATVEPLTSRILEITPTRSSKLTAYAAITIAALMVGCWGAVTLDTFAARRAVRKADRRPSRSASAPPPVRSPAPAAGGSPS